MSESITNIVGVPFKKYVQEQISTRATQGSTINRNNDQVSYLANKNCWIQLSSFVDLIETDVKTQEGGDYLAKNWILLGGTAFYDQGVNKLRTGVQENFNYNFEKAADESITNNSAYGLGGTNQYGYRPMPGITSATIEHAGRAGSLRFADVKFKVWNRDQLDIIEKLYFRLGYSCLLEWGHSVYYDNNGKLITSTTPLDIFNRKNKTLYGSKENIIKAINEKREQSFGNYDALYGTIYNYEWSQSSDGGYDCYIKVVGLGSIVDSLKINQSYTMPAGDDESLTKTTTYDGAFPEAKNNTGNNPSIPERKINDSNTGILFTDYFYESIEGKDQLEIIPDQFKEYGNEQAQITIQYQANNTKISNLKRTTISVSDLFRILDDSKGDIQTKYLFNFDINEITNNNVKTTVLKLFKDINVNNGLEIRYNTQTKKVESQNSLVDNVVELYQDIGEGILNLFGFETIANNLNIKTEENPIKTVTLSKINIQIDFRNPNNVLKLVNPNLRKITSESIGLNVKNIHYLLARFKQEYITLINNTETFNSKIKLIANSSNKFLLKFSLEYEPVGNTPQAKFDNYRNTANTLVELGINLLNDQKEIYKGSISLNNLFSDNPNIGINSFNKSNNQKYNFSLFDAKFNYDESKLTSDSNTIPDIPGNATSEDQTILNKSLTSNLTKFLIKIRDSVDEGSSIQNKSELISGLLKAGALEPIRLKNLNPQDNNDQSILYRNIQKGFNSGIMGGLVKQENINNIPNVDFEKLFEVYSPGIVLSGELESKFVYIKLGLLLYYLNNSSLLYEYGSDNKTKKPYVYIDFNPETNFCLTTNYHFSVDPEVCLIPINFSLNDYKNLFPKDVINNEKIINTKGNENTADILSSEVPTGFIKQNESKFQKGRIMDIAVNIDYVINLISSQAQNNPKSDVYLRSFLETIMEDINKSLGNINLFRVGYFDDGNTVRIYDDQILTPESFETIITKENQSKHILIPSGVPVIGKNSIVRNLQLKSDISTRIGSRIAISAQAGNFGALNNDASSLGALNNDPNLNLVDRVMPKKEEALNPKTEQETELSEGDIVSAKKFNSLVFDLYANKIFKKQDVELAKNYYATAANKTKAENTSTKSRVTLPLSVEVTMDGISGMTLLEGFILPTNVLPKQYVDSQNRSKIGFSVAGLNHSISDNQWITSIRGIMIILPESTQSLLGDFGEVSSVRRQAPINASNVNVDISDINLNQDYLRIAFDFIAKEETFEDKAYWDANAYRVGYGTDTILRSNGNLEKVTPTTRVTLQEATNSLIYDIKNRFEPGVIRAVSLNSWNQLNKNQKAALLSYAYNAGAGAISSRKISDAIKNKNYSLAANNIQSGPVTSNGKVLDVLIKRRKKESILFLTS